jgi:hypothetical protein
MAGVLQATLDSPGLAPVVGVIIPQLKAQATAGRNRRPAEKEERSKKRRSKEEKINKAKGTKKLIGLRAES